MIKRHINNSRGMGLAEIIVIAIIVGFVVLISVRIIKKNMDTAVKAGAETTATDADDDASEEEPKGAVSAPGKIIEGAKKSLEKTQRTLPPDLQEEGAADSDED